MRGFSSYFLYFWVSCLAFWASLFLGRRLDLPSLCPLCLCGKSTIVHHRDTEDTERT